MTLFKNGWLAFALATTLFTACKHKKEDPAPSVESLLTSKDWVMTAGTSSFQYTGASQQVDIYENMESCEKDNHYRFRADKKSIVTSGATKCDPNEADETESGEWELLSDNKKIRMQDPSTGENFIFDIVTITADALTVKGSLDIEAIPGSGVKILTVVEITYRHP